MIVCAMVVGPGEGHRYLDRSLRCASAWADMLLVLIDGGDPDVADAVHFTTRYWAWRAGPRLHGHEGEVRNSLMEGLDRTADQHDLVVCLDADEELVALDGRTVAAHLRDLAMSGGDAWGPRFVHLWAADGSVARVDGGWVPAPQAAIYRHRRGGRVADKPLATGRVPVWATVWAPCDLVVRHWGYARPHDRAAKHAVYMEVDGGRYHALWHLDSIIDPEPELVPWRTSLTSTSPTSA